MKRYKTVEDYISAQDQWKQGLLCLRDIIGKTELAETVKWGAPAYTVDGKNVIGIGAFKSFFAIWFFQGVFLADKHGKLINAQEGKTKALRQWRFTAQEEIDEKLVLAYLDEAIRNQKLGKEIKADKTKPLIVPDELRVALKANPKAQSLFDSFTLTRKREFADYITEAKQNKTKVRRLEKILPMIEANIGLYDKYKK